MLRMCPSAHFDTRHSLSYCLSKASGESQLLFPGLSPYLLKRLHCWTRFFKELSKGFELTSCRLSSHGVQHRHCRIGFVPQTAVFVFATGITSARFLATDFRSWTDVGLPAEFVFTYLWLSWLH